ncbi:two-component system regulatory protein YycI [Thalassobacillus sp. B23F22_16]|uniref:two-component system regulatory protein YycI n=1 Tax=Thalassobacillus sp. B23F22_16 TaxID=3459513 RepID=UPI00373DF3EA
MQWGQIKTLFILSFLILDLFLLQQFLGKQDENLEQIEESTPAEEQLALENIDYSEIPEEQEDIAFINGSRAEFSEEDMAAIDSIEGISRPDFDNDNLLYVQFNDPISIEDDDSSEEIMDKVDDYIIYGDQYAYWGKNEEHDVLLFFQKNNNRTIYFNESGLLMFLVEDGSITGYYQTILGNIESENEKTELVQPISAVYQLYDNGDIVSGDKITDMVVGYHSKTKTNKEDPTGIQVFAPTWKITVNNEEIYFVNATEGKVLDIEEDEFILDTMETVEASIPLKEEEVKENPTPGESSESDDTNE